MPGCLGAAVISASPQSRGKLFFKHVFNEAPDTLANPSLERIKPIRTQQWNFARDRDILRHGVISSGGANRRVLRYELGDYATFKFPPPKRRDPSYLAGVENSTSGPVDRQRRHGRTRPRRRR
jgi:hypothetical protein